MDTTSLKHLAIPEGKAIKLKIDGTTVWRDSDYYDVDNEVVYSKTVPSYAEKDSVLRVGGRSIVWNQLVNNATLPATQTINGVTLTNNGDGSVTIDGTNDGTERSIFYLQSPFSFIDGHAYMLIGSEAMTGWYKFCMNFGGDITYASDTPSGSSFVGNNNQRKGAIARIQSYSGSHQLRVTIWSGISVSNVTFYPQVVDLTQLFGVGNEASALGVANFTTQANVETAINNFFKIFPDNHYTYNTGEVKSAGVSQVEVKDDDGVVTSTATIPSSIQALDGYGWSAGTAYNYVDYENKKYHKRVAKVDLGSLNWYWYGEVPTGEMIFYSDSLLGIISCSNGTKIHAICSTYTSYPNDSYITLPNKGCRVRSSDGRLYFVNNDYSSASDFKASLSGIYLYYELKTEVITDISSLLTSGFLQDINVEVGGSLTFKNTLGDSYRLPVPVRNEFKLGIHTYSQLANAVAGGARSELIGLEIPDTWRDTAGTSYDDPAIVVDVRQVEDANGVSHWSAICQRKWASKDAIQFDAAEQVLATGVYESGLYYYTISGTTATLLVAGTDYQVGDTIVGTVYKNSIRDTIGRILIYGYNRYRDSAYRQYLNSGDAISQWWESTHVGDVAPNQHNSVRGYKAGCSAELLSAVKPIKITCKTNTATDGGVTDTMYDEFWLPSGIEVYGTSNEGDGTYFPYWKESTGLASPSNSANAGRIIYKIDNHSRATDYRLRTSHLNSSFYEGICTSSGSLDAFYSYDSNYCTPCFAIYK